MTSDSETEHQEEVTEVEGEAVEEAAAVATIHHATETQADRLAGDRRIVTHSQDVETLIPMFREGEEAPLCVTAMVVGEVDPAHLQCLDLLHGAVVADPPLDPLPARPRPRREGRRET